MQDRVEKNTPGGSGILGFVDTHAWIIMLSKFACLLAIAHFQLLGGTSSTR